nr:putative mating-type 1-1-1 L protein [Endoconidiophora polonica]
MGVPIPEDYLTKLCWVYAADDTGVVTFLQDPAGFALYLASVNNALIPITDQDLLCQCLVREYFPEYADMLLAKLAESNSSSIIKVPNCDHESCQCADMFSQNSFTSFVSPPMSSSLGGTFHEFTVSVPELAPVELPEVMATEPHSLWYTNTASPLDFNFQPMLIDQPVFDVFGLPETQVFDITDNFQMNNIAFQSIPQTFDDLHQISPNVPELPE